ncbi:hypothetical protein L1887_25390 [Cichorium endivia]|nr:hypothetical protein L1887_25390 [Cichorium endivia]
MVSGGLLNHSGRAEMRLNHGFRGVGAAGRSSAGAKVVIRREHHRRFRENMVESEFHIAGVGRKPARAVFAGEEEVAGLYCRSPHMHSRRHEERMIGHLRVFQFSLIGPITVG